jgi:hypothetical protein
MQLGDLSRRIASMALVVIALVACSSAVSDPVSTPDATRLPDSGGPTPDRADPDSHQRFDLAEDLYVRKMAVYLTGIYMDPAAREALEAAYRATGKRMDVGKSCVRFRKPDDLPLELIGESIRKFGVDEFVEQVKQAHAPGKDKRSSSKSV